MQNSETLRQAIEFLKERPMPDVKMADIPRLHQWWQRLHEMAAQAVQKEQVGAGGSDYGINPD